MIEKWLRDFHEKYGHLTSDRVLYDCPPEILELRLQLIREEVIKELIPVLESMIAARKMGVVIDRATMTDAFDGVLDSVYVLVGTCISLGLPFEQGFQEVHMSNMTKTAVKAAPGQKYGTKNPKGPDFRPPDLARLL